MRCYTLGMQLTDEDIAKLGTLGRLALTPEQRHTYAEQLSRIVEYTDRITKADVAATSTTLRPILPAEQLREDRVEASDGTATRMLAPKREGDFIVSPPIA